MDNTQTEATININDLILILWKNIILIVSITILFTIGANIITRYFISEKYESNTLINVFKNAEYDDYVNNSDIFRYGTELAKRYYIIADSETVIYSVQTKLYDDLGINLSKKEIRDSLKVESVNDTDFLTLTVTYKDPIIAKEIAQAVTDISKLAYEEVYENATVKVIDSAEEGIKVGPNIVLNTLIGFILGLLISVGAVLLKEFLDNTIRDEKDVEKYLGVPVLGSIPIINKN